MKNKYIHIWLSVAFLVIESCQPSYLFAQTVKLKWLNFSPYTEVGQNPNQGDSISDAQIICLLDTLKPWVEGIRTFGTQNGLQNIPILAKQKGFKVIVGIWLGKENSAAGIAANQQQIANGIALANAGYADKLIVGSEVLLRGDLIPSQLINYINQVQIACPNIPVSCADIYSELICHPEVMNACDFIFPNIYPFWEGTSINCAIQRFHQCYQDLLPFAIDTGKEIIISESGWKTEGNPVGNAVPSLENAIRYNRELLNWSTSFNIDVNLFCAFDEPWKLPNDYGWGIFTNDKTMKQGMDTLFKVITNIDSTWLCSTLSNGSNDTFIVDNIPGYSNYSLIKGHVDNIKPCEYRIATYIKVGGWWTKPTFCSPTVPILCDGQWSVDYTTGGNDNLATEICLFVVPFGYFPPLCGNCIDIPQEVYQNSIDSICVHRYELSNAALIASSDTICKGESITLTASEGKYFTWGKITWEGVNYLTSEGDTSSSIVITPDNSPYTTYIVQISDGMGGGVTLQKTIVVIEIGLSVPSKIVCAYDSVATLTANTWGPAWYDYEFYWSTGESSQSIQVVPISPSASYSVTVSSIAGCTKAYIGTVYVEEPQPILNYPNDTIQLGQTVGMYVWAVEAIWSTGDTTHNKSLYVSPTTTTTYTVTVTLGNGCVYELENTIVVLQPNATIEGINIQNLIIFPNPANETFTVKFNTDKEENIHVSLVNEMGVVIEIKKARQEAGEFLSEFNASQLTKGLYFIQLYANYKEISIGKIVIQ
ncbi:MAG: T9SS type A sorting domain-containing protein [Saprospiraceae bacterium]|nr:T9SS type A sorting domain-containing protein [Saprospiraceae bacterium]